MSGHNHSETPSRNTKRQRPSTSPNSAEDSMLITGMESEKVGDLTQGQLMAGLSSLLDDKLSNLATKHDLMTLSVTVSDLVEENKLLKEEVKNLKAQEKVVLNKLLDLEGRSRRNNLIFRGLKWVGKAPDYRQLVTKFCNEVLGAGERLWVNRAHPLGRDSKAIIAHIPEDTDIEYIMNQVRRLKGTGYSVHRDYPQEVRAKRECLSAVRAEVEKVAGHRRMPLFYDHLTVDGCRLTWEDGELKAGNQNGADKLNTMFNHDFSGFLINLQQSKDRRGKALRRASEERNTGETNVKDTEIDKANVKGPAV